MTISEVHLPEPSESGTAHYWSVGDKRGSVSLSALQLEDEEDLVNLVQAAPSAGALAAITSNGTWLFDVMQSHRLVYGSQWPCSRHPNCEVDAFVTRYAQPVWGRIRDAGVTEDAVFAELRRVHADEFSGGTR